MIFNAQVVPVKQSKLSIIVCAR